MSKIKMCNFLVKKYDSVKLYVEKHLTQTCLHYNFMVYNANTFPSHPT